MFTRADLFVSFCYCELSCLFNHYAVKAFDHTINIQLQQKQSRSPGSPKKMLLLCPCGKWCRTSSKNTLSGSYMRQQLQLWIQKYEHPVQWSLSSTSSTIWWSLNLVTVPYIGKPCFLYFFLYLCLLFFHSKNILFMLLYLLFQQSMIQNSWCWIEAYISFTNVRWILLYCSVMIMTCW